MVGVSSSFPVANACPRRGPSSLAVNIFPGAVGILVQSSPRGKPSWCCNSPQVRQNRVVPASVCFGAQPSPTNRTLSQDRTEIIGMHHILVLNETHCANVLRWNGTVTYILYATSLSDGARGRALLCPAHLLRAHATRAGLPVRVCTARGPHRRNVRCICCASAVRTGPDGHPFGSADVETPVKEGDVVRFGVMHNAYRLAWCSINVCCSSVNKVCAAAAGRGGGASTETRHGRRSPSAPPLPRGQLKGTGRMSAMLCSPVSSQVVQ